MRQNKKNYYNLQDFLLSIVQSDSNLQIDLNNSNIGVQGASDLASCLSKYKNLQTLFLNLSLNNLGTEGALVLGEQLQKDKDFIHIESLVIKLCSNNIQDEGVKGLSSFLNKFPHVQDLEIDLVYNEIGDDGVQYLSSSLRNKQNISTLKLDLAFNKIQESGAENLSSAFANLTKLQNLKINLLKNKIRHNGASILGIALQKCNLLTTLELQLYENKIGSEGLKALSQGLTNCKLLIKLDLLLRANEIDETCMKNFGQSLNQCITLQNLTINFCWNKIGYIGVQDFCSSYLMQSPKLKDFYLNLDNNNIGSKGVAELGINLAKCANIQTLELEIYLNSIKALGATNLVSALVKSQSVSKLILYFGGAEIGDIGAKDLCQQLPNCSNLKYFHLSLHRNSIGDDTISLGSYLVEYKNLRELSLDFQFNKIKEDQAIDLIIDLKKCNNIQVLRLILRNNQIQKVLQQKLETELLKLNRLVNLFQFNKNYN
ncbi:hypothetical protein ABPG74_006801 [Tetrahymena malaccensis]